MAANYSIGVHSLLFAACLTDVVAQRNEIGERRYHGWTMALRVLKDTLAIG